MEIRRRNHLCLDFGDIGLGALLRGAQDQQVAFDFRQLRAQSKDFDFREGAIGKQLFGDFDLAPQGGRHGLQPVALCSQLAALRTPLGQPVAQNIKLDRQLFTPRFENCALCFDGTRVKTVPIRKFERFGAAGLRTKAQQFCGKRLVALFQLAQAGLNARVVDLEKYLSRADYITFPDFDGRYHTAVGRLHGLYLAAGHDPSGSAGDFLDFKNCRPDDKAPHQCQNGDQQQPQPGPGIAATGSVDKFLVTAAQAEHQDGPPAETGALAVSFRITTSLGPFKATRPCSSTTKRSAIPASDIR